MNDFPSLARSDLVYFDAAAMAPMHADTEALLNKPRVRTNVHRAVYPEGESTDALFYQARSDMATRLGCKASDLSFCDRTTLGLNHLSFALEDWTFRAGAVIWVSRLEHHSNWLPWQRLAIKKNLMLVEIPLNPNTLLPDEDWMAKAARSNPPALCAITHASNVTGGVVDLKRIRGLLGEETLLVVDGAQAVAHLTVQLDFLNLDAYVCSGYKFGASTGTGLLYLSSRLQSLTPAFRGGGMVDVVSPNGSEFKSYPEGWEPGTPNLDGILTLATAHDTWFSHPDFRTHEMALWRTLRLGLKSLPSIQTLADELPETESIGVVSFISTRWHPHDLGTLLGEKRFAVRVGHHCAQRLHTSISHSSSVRVSFGPYNTHEEVARFLTALHDIEKGKV